MLPILLKVRSNLLRRVGRPEDLLKIIGIECDDFKMDIMAMLF
jgi:hypothetical protein